jgi:hypothetical protein
MKMDSDVLLLSYLDKIYLILTGELWRALACLYSEARLYNGAREVSLLWAHSLPYRTGLPYWSAMLNMVKS